MDEADFLTLMRRIETTWTQGDAAGAASLFDDDAVYEEPPRRQFYRGQRAILAFFEAVMTDGPRLTMVWRNLAFDARHGIGFGEYTFARLAQFHGIVVVQVRDGRIVRWREYQYRSDLPWKEFAGESEFSTAP